MSEDIPESLHRLKNNQNDWDGLEPDEMNIWQKIAKKTRGIITAANAVTIASTVVVMNGLADYVNGNKVEGVVKVAAGRLGDVADGLIADKSGTKGRVGRALDPGVDFVQLCIGLPMLVQADVLPIVPALAIAVPKVIDAAATVSATVRHKEMNPTIEGKRSITAIWTGIGALMLKGTIDKHAPGFVDTALDVVGWGGTIGGAVYHIPASVEYVSIGFGTKESQGFVEQQANIQQ